MVFQLFLLFTVLFCPLLWRFGINIIFLFSYKKASSSRQQSADHEKHLENSTELKSIVTMSGGTGLDTYETVNDSKEYTYAVVEKGNRKSKCGRNESSFYEQEAGMLSDDGPHFPKDHSEMVQAAEKTVESSAESKSKEDEERKDCVYAVVHIKPGQTTACKEPTIQRESLDPTCTEHHSSKAEGTEELMNISSFGHGKEITNNETATEQNPQGGEECKEYLYAVVDKANKKRRPPQVLASCTYS